MVFWNPFATSNVQTIWGERDYFNKEIKQTENNDPNLINIFMDARLQTTNTSYHESIKFYKAPKTIQPYILSRNGRMSLAWRYLRKIGLTFGRVRPGPPAPDLGGNSAGNVQYGILLLLNCHLKSDLLRDWMNIEGSVVHLWWIIFIFFGPAL